MSRVHRLDTTVCCRCCVHVDVKLVIVDSVDTLIHVMSVRSKPFSDTARWVCLYPSFIDVSKTSEQGRRIPKANVRYLTIIYSNSCCFLKAVSDPKASEIFDILQHAGLKCEHEVYLDV